MQYELRELADRLGLDLSTIARGLLHRAWGPLQAEGAPEAAQWDVAHNTSAVPDVAVVNFVPHFCTIDGTLHPVLATVFGDERGVIRALSNTPSYEVELARNLESIEKHFARLLVDGASDAHRDSTKDRNTAVKEASSTAMAAIVQEVVEAQVIAVVGLQASYGFVNDCLIEY
eukprot:SAG31_NODE_1974_length_6755_cov_6.833383_3_plen_173_part_00